MGDASKNLKMKSLINVLFFFVVAILAAVSTSDTGEVGLMKFLEKERKERREEQEVIREIFKKENARLEKEDQHLHERNDQLQRQDDEQREQIANQSKEIIQQKAELVNQKQRIDKQNEEMAKLRDQNRKLHAKLRQADSKIRQADSKFDSRINQAIRQKDQNLTAELKKLMKSEITNFLINERICVGGEIQFWDSLLPEDRWVDHVVQYGYEFPREPIVSASLKRLFLGNTDEYVQAYIKIKSVSNSSAVIQTYRWAANWFYVSWLACL